ncbi:MAG TPA: energy transducer TonB [Bryobacteraceae bacterium]|nr:energy transducer TonB [Bryobacteraceae bacterium]
MNFTFLKVLYRVKPDYSEEGRMARNQGTVVLLVRVDKSGHPSGIKVSRALGTGLDEQAVRAIRRWRFRPATDRGKPVSMETTVEAPLRLQP